MKGRQGFSNFNYFSVRRLNLRFKSLIYSSAWCIIQNMKTNMQLKIPVSIFKEDATFIAYSPVLDLSTSGKSFEVVQKRFKEAVIIFFEELSDKGTLNQVLTGLGWKKVRSEWNPPMLVSHELANISVPSVN